MATKINDYLVVGLDAERVNYASIPDDAVYVATDVLKFYKMTAGAWAHIGPLIRFLSQNDQPTPESGEVLLWKDADAVSTEPTHYLVANDGASVVTFASEEVVA